MKYLLLVHHNEDMFNQIPEIKRKEMLAESIQLCHQLDGKGQYVHASPLQPEATGIAVRERNSKATVTDGPLPRQKSSSPATFSSKHRIGMTPFVSPRWCRVLVLGQLRSGR